MYREVNAQTRICAMINQSETRPARNVLTGGGAKLLNMPKIVLTSILRSGKMLRMVALVFVLCVCTYSVQAQAPAPSPTGGGTKPACIDGVDLVITPVGPKRVEHLQVGDRVAVDEHGRFGYVISFLHRDASRNARGFVFTTSGGTKVTLSDLHLVFVSPCCKKAIAARKLEIGQKLCVVKDGAYRHEIIESIERTRMTGRYSPLTRQGTILVNGVLVSCYSQCEDHHLMHKITNWLLKLPFAKDIFAADGLIGNKEGLHWIGDVMWNYLRHWFIVGESGY